MPKISISGAVCISWYKLFWVRRMLSRCVCDCVCVRVKTSFLCIYTTATSEKYLFQKRTVLYRRPCELLQQGVTKRCRLSWLTIGALEYEPKCGGRGELRGLSRWVQLYAWSPNKLWRSNSIFNLFLADSSPCISPEIHNYGHSPFSGGEVICY